jgi:hypothetical protein
MKTHILASAAAALLLLPVAASAQASYQPKNDEANPYKPGVSFGQLPDGRKWGSTAGIDIAPDGTLWAYE